MRRRFASRGRTVVACRARPGRYARMAERRRRPGRSFVARVAALSGWYVRRRLSARGRSVVAGSARARADAGMVEDRGCPRTGLVAGIATL